MHATYDRHPTGYFFALIVIISELVKEKGKMNWTEFKKEIKSISKKEMKKIEEQAIQEANKAKRR